MFFDKILSTLILIAVFYLVFYIGKLAHDLLHKGYDLNHELVKNDNPALALAMAGYYFGLVLAIGGTLIGESYGIIGDVIDLSLYGVLSVILLNLSWFICDKVILSHFKITDELIRDRNQGTGAVSCGVSIASGLIIYGAVSGEGGHIWTAIIFWAIGQLMLIIAGKVYNFMVPYSIHDEIEKDNVAAGVSFGGAIVAVGIIVGLAAEGDFTSWSKDLFSFIGIAVLGLILLPVIRFLTDKVLLPTEKLSDEIANQEIPNVGAAYIEASSYIGAAFLIYWCI